MSRPSLRSELLAIRDHYTKHHVFFDLWPEGELPRQMGYFFVQHQRMTRDDRARTAVLGQGAVTWST